MDSPGMLWFALFISVSSVKSSDLDHHATLKQLNDGEIIQGSGMKMFTAISPVHCSASCLRDVSCKVFQYKNQTTNNCVTIHDNNDNSTGEDPVTLVASNENRIFKKHVDYCATSPCQNGGACINQDNGYRCECPSGYIGSNCADVDNCPAENPCYNGGTCVDGPGSFTCDCTDNYGGATCRLNCTHPWCTLIPWPPGERPELHIPFELPTEFIRYNSPGFIPGKVDSAIRLNRALRQWVDLGDVSGYSCISRPETCGPNGGSLTAWIRLLECPKASGFLTSTGLETTGFRTYCHVSGFNFLLDMTHDAYVVTALRKPTGWLHLTIIYHGTGTGNGVSVYYDGELVSEDKMAQMTGPKSSSSGQIVIGRRLYHNDRGYATIEIDELTLWNNN